MPNQSAAPVRLLRLREVCTLVGLSRSAIYRRIDAATFPRPVSLGARAVAWRNDALQAWIAARGPAPADSPVGRKSAVSATLHNSEVTAVPSHHEARRDDEHTHTA